MPRGIDWSPAMRAKLRGMRAKGHTLDAIAAVLSISKQAVMCECHRIGLPTGNMLHHQVMPPEPARRDWSPLPAGHPSSWGLISNQPWPQPGMRAA